MDWEMVHNDGLLDAATKPVLESADLVVMHYILWTSKLYDWLTVFEATVE